MDIDEKKLSAEVITEVEILLKKLDKREQLRHSLELTNIEPLGNCPLINILPIGAIKACRDKHADNCHTIKINYKKKCGGKQTWG